MVAFGQIRRQSVWERNVRPYRSCPHLDHPRTRLIMLTESMTPAPATVLARPSRGLHVMLWLVQVLLAAVFLLVGFTHAAEPIEVAVTRAPWIASLPVALLRFIGVTELAGALGLLLPAAT